MDFEIFALALTLPTLSLLICFVFFILYLTGRKKELPAEKLQSYRSLAKVFGVTALVLYLLAGAFTALLFWAVANM